jgi:murein DD-endopeptidase MepM/ murein hydrolase activator NlpD
MRLLVGCLAALLVVLSLLGSGTLNVASQPPSAVPASVTQWWGTLEPLARQYDVDPLLVAAVMTQESGGDPFARSWAGANGLMQVLDGPFEPNSNLESGIHILATQLQAFKNVRAALAAYNAGPGLSDADAALNPAMKYAGVRGAARQAGASVNDFDKYYAYLPAETRKYVPAVMALYDKFSNGTAALSATGGPIRMPLDQFTWTPTFGKDIGNGQPAHTGEDLIASCGTPVKAMFNGTLVYRGCLYGNCKDGGAANGATGHGLVVIEQFDANRYAVYAHLANYVTDKDVRAGDLLGTVGMTGWTLGCHLHYAIWNGSLEDLLKDTGKGWVDPKQYFPTAVLRD